MEPDILAAIIAFVRSQSALVTAFGENLSASPPIIKFYADTAGQSIPALPYLVLTEPQSVEGFETPGPNDDGSSVVDGVIGMEVYASSKTTSRQLADQVAAVLNDCEGSLGVTGIGIFYFRRTTLRFPIITTVGPDGNPTAYGRIIQFRYLYEQTP